MSGEPDAASAQDAGFAREVGEAVRRRRRALGMTSRDLARRAGVSAPFITQLERGRSSISLPRFYRVAEVLGTTPNALLPATSTALALTRSGDGEEMPAAHGGGAPTSRLLTRGGEGVALKAHHYVMEPGGPSQDWFEHGGEDFVYVIRGRLLVEFADGRHVELAAGDALHHDGAVAHRWSQLGEEVTEALIVNDVHG